jgi:AbrB family looped-hinge helix DNA binding protein|tara:strand:+ start:11420 stop:11671 length:252 start_codon:yes stop_codon:yes gene_type:complete
MEITKLSTKGQIVIPEKIRAGIEDGTAFVVTKKEDLIVLKKVEGLSESELKEMEELDKIWKDIDEGKGITVSKEEFLKEMNAW